jgi:hypothetical protein
VHLSSTHSPSHMACLLTLTARASSLHIPRLALHGGEAFRGDEVPAGFLPRLSYDLGR